MVFLHMCEKLYDLNAKLQIVPQLAAALPTLSADKKTMTIKTPPRRPLQRRNAVERAAVKTSLDRHRTLPGSARASEISPITAVEVVNNYTVRLRLNARFSPLTGPARRPRGDDHVAEAARRARRQVRIESRCASGLQVRQPRRPATGSRSTKSRSSTTRGARSSSNRIVFRIITDTSARAANLRSHDVKVLDRIAVDRPACDPARPEPARPEGDVDRLPGDLDQHREQERDREAVRERRHAARLASSALRQAFELSLDRKVINRVVFGGTVLPGCLPVPPASPYFDKSIKCPARNLDRARPLIRSTGVHTPSTSG